MSLVSVPIISNVNGVGGVVAMNRKRCKEVVMLLLISQETP